MYSNNNWWIIILILILFSCGGCGFPAMNNCGCNCCGSCSGNNCGCNNSALTAVVVTTAAAAATAAAISTARLCRKAAKRTRRYPSGPLCAAAGCYK